MGRSSVPQTKVSRRAARGPTSRETEPCLAIELDHAVSRTLNAAEDEIPI
jgi:hypothetical protein